MRQSEWTFFYWFVCSTVRLLLRIWDRFEIHNPENVPAVGGCIIASNHVSYLDPPAVAVGIKHRVVHFMARDLRGCRSWRSRRTRRRRRGRSARRRGWTRASPSPSTRGSCSTSSKRWFPAVARVRRSPEEGAPEAEETAAAAPEGPEEPPCLDPRYLRELSDLGGNSDFVVRLAWTFLKGSKEKVRGLERAVADRDVEKARELAHALKGNSGQIGALALMRACERFSGIAAGELERNGGTYLEEVKEELSRARTALDEYLGTRNSAV